MSIPVGSTSVYRVSPDTVVAEPTDPLGKLSVVVTGAELGTEAVTLPASTVSEVVNVPSLSPGSALSVSATFFTVSLGPHGPLGGAEVGTAHTRLPPFEVGSPAAIGDPPPKENCGEPAT